MGILQNTTKTIGESDYMKCPYCGSTAQPRMVAPPYISNITNLLTEPWRCGCGCHFVIEYRRNNKGLWGYHNKSLVYVEEKNN